MADDFSPLLKGSGKLPHTRSDDLRTRKFYAQFSDVELALRKSELQTKRHTLLNNFPELVDEFIRRSHPQGGKLLNIDRRLDIINSELASRLGVPVTGAEARPEEASAVSQPASHPEKTEHVPQESAQDCAARRRRVIEPLLRATHRSVYRWEKDAGVSSKIGRRYFDGKTYPRVEQAKRLARVLGLAELPD